jgi:hypothetical protein
MTKTLNQIIFFSPPKSEYFFSNIGNQNILLEKKHNPPPPPLQVKWSFPKLNNLLTKLICKAKQNKSKATVK